MPQIRRDEQRQFKQHLSDEKIREIVKQNEVTDWSKWSRPTLQLLSKHDWLPLKLIEEAIGVNHASLHRVSVHLRERKLVESKYATYHHVNRAMWIRITAEGRRTIQPAKKGK